MSCSHLKSCPLFAQFALHPALGLWQERYCEADYSGCARYQASKKAQAVPVTLLPNGKLLEVKSTDDDMRGGVLFNAVLNNRVWMLENLIHRVGVDMNYRNIEGVTALMVASQHGLEDMVRILIEAGADLTLQDVGGQTAYDMAAKAGHVAVADLLRQATPVSARARQQRSA